MLHLTHDENSAAYCELTNAKFALVRVVGCPIKTGREVVQAMCAVGINPETSIQTVWIDGQSEDGDACRYERTFNEGPDEGFVYHWALEMLSKTVSHDRLLKYGFTYEA